MKPEQENQKQAAKEVRESNKDIPVEAERKESHRHEEMSNRGGVGMKKVESNAAVWKGKGGSEASSGASEQMPQGPVTKKDSRLLN